MTIFLNNILACTHTYNTICTILFSFQFTDSGLPSDPIALEKHVVSKMADNWYQFGIHLGLPEDTLKAIDDSKLLNKNSARCLVMFQRWMEEIGPVENKIDKIEQAMKEVVKVR